MTRRNKCLVTRGKDNIALRRVPLNRTSSNAFHSTAFTLVELLTVIAIIAILAAMLVPALLAAKTHAKITQAKLQISDLMTAIQKYDGDYSRMPLTSQAQNEAVANGGSFTFGGMFQTPNNTWPNPVPANYYPSNNEVISILMDITNYPGTTMATVNTNSTKNPQQTQYLNARRAADTNAPGVGPDLNYRDPWKNPYIITLDVNEDNQCKDPFYSLALVSGSKQQNVNPGLNSLISPDTSVRDNFRYHGNIMIWSAGPDGKVDPGQPANQGFNEDNIISWQQ